LKSLIGAVEGYIARYLDIYGSKINRFISPSRFLLDKVIQCGVSSDKVVHIPNFVDTNHFKPSFKGSDYFVYFGRMEEFKGIRTLIKAFSNVKNAKLYLLGTGSLLNHFKQQSFKNGLKNIQFLGFKQGDELKKIIQNCLCTICPSEWFENNPISVLESFALGKAVIGTFEGGIPEMVEDRVNGLLFPSGDASKLAQTIEHCLTNPDHLRDMGREARRKAETLYSPELHYRRITELYRELLQ
jgi:glycosyltransferase involved in cell wall biosynthesis